MIFFKTGEEGPKDDSDIIRTASLVSKVGSLSPEFQQTRKSLPISVGAVPPKDQGAVPLKAVGTGTLSSRAKGCGCLHLDIKRWSLPELWAHNQTKVHREAVVTAGSTC